MQDSGIFTLLQEGYQTKRNTPNFAKIDQLISNIMAINPASWNAYSKQCT